MTNKQVGARDRGDHRWRRHPGHGAAGTRAPDRRRDAGAGGREDRNRQSRAGHLHAHRPRRQHRPHCGGRMARPSSTTSSPTWCRRSAPRWRCCPRSPCSFVINTHLHGDHTGGNDAFGAAGAVIIAHENVRKRLGSAAGESFDQRRISRRGRARHCRWSRSPIPRRCISTTKICEFTHLPNAHTETDIVIRFRKANVLHMGDCFTGGFPFIDSNTGGTLDGLILAHEKVLAIDRRQHESHSRPRPARQQGRAAGVSRHAGRGARSRRETREGRQDQEQVVEARPTKEFEEKYGGGTSTRRSG